MVNLMVKMCSFNFDDIHIFVLFCFEQQTYLTP